MIDDSTVKVTVNTATENKQAALPERSTEQQPEVELQRVSTGQEIAGRLAHEGKGATQKLLAWGIELVSEWETSGSDATSFSARGRLAGNADTTWNDIARILGTAASAALARPSAGDRTVGAALGQETAPDIAATVDSARDPAAAQYANAAISAEAEVRLDQGVEESELSAVASAEGAGEDSDVALHDGAATRADHEEGIDRSRAESMHSAANAAATAPAKGAAPKTLRAKPGNRYLPATPPGPGLGQPMTPTQGASRER